MMDSTKKDLAEGPGSVPQSDYRHGHGGDLVDINSYQPAAVAPAALHLSQVPENMRSVGHEPAVAPLPPLPTPAPPAKLVYEPEAGTFVPDNTSSTGRTDPKASTDRTDGTLLDQVVHKAEGIFSDVKDLAGTAFGEMKEKATGAWQAVAGTIGAGPGKELAEDGSEQFVAGQNRELHQVQPGSTEVSRHGVDLGVDISSYQPPAGAPAGIYPHGEIRTGDKSGHRPSEVVGEDTANP